MTINQTERVSDEELDQMIWKLERDGMTPKQLSLMRELREVRRAKGEPVAYADQQAFLNFKSEDGKNAACTKEWMWRDSAVGLIPLYTAPPAPVVDADDNFYSWFGREWHEHYQQNQYTTAAKQMLGVMAESAWKAGRAAMLQVGNSRGTPDEQSFWNWLRDKMPTTYRWSRELEDTPENSALITKGKASALDMLSAWKGCSAAMQLSGDTADMVEPVSNRDELPAKCWCQTCRPVTMNDMRFVVCPECGNKRCPRANDHRNACTGSNAPGQDGSAYPAAPKEVKGDD